MAAQAQRAPDSLPDESRPPGAPDETLPFDHIVLVVLENHSFDNLLGALAKENRAVDGLKFNPQGEPLDSNPDSRGQPLAAFEFPDDRQGSDVSQSWNDTHEQIHGGAMDGFVRAAHDKTQPMGFWTGRELPFTYSFARSFSVANRWFCSAPCQTVPNRRFLFAGTARGAISSSPLGLIKDPPPPNGTIFARLNRHGISWRNYATDVPYSLFIPSLRSVRLRNLWHLRWMRCFRKDCARGKLPAVSFVDPEVGALSLVGEVLGKLPLIKRLGQRVARIGGSEEDPQDMGYGERWAYKVVSALLASPCWPRTLLIYTYDEHGGYYDHVPPPPAIPPDDVQPDLDEGDAPGGYDMYGVRVPAIVASPYVRAGSASDTVYDHTSILATIERKWNLPALTYRDANANTVLDMLDLAAPPELVEPPELSAPPGA